MVHLLIGLIGGLIGSIIIAVIKNSLEKSKAQHLRHNELIEERYRYVLMIMACVLDFDNRNFFILHEKRPGNSSEEYLRILKEYYYHGLLCSSDNVILRIKKFIEVPCLKNYIETAIEMRKNLWSKKTHLKYENIVLS